MAKQLFRIPNIFGGMDTNHTEEIKASAGKFRAVQNMRFDGVVGKKRGGQSVYGGAVAHLDANSIVSAFRFYPDDYTRVQIVSSGTNLYKGKDSDGTYTSIKSGLTSGKRFSFTTMYDISGNLQCIMFNGYDTPQQWDGNAGSTSAITGSPPLDKFVVWHKDRLFTAGSAATPHNLNFCANSNPNDWTTADDAGTIDVGFKITGLATLADYLVIFGEKQIKLLIGYSYDTYQLTEPFTDFGTVCPYSIAMGNGVIYFLTQVANGQYHVATFDGASARLLNMDEVIISMPYPARVEQISGVYYNNRYLLAYPSTDGANDRQLVYNAKLGFYESLDVGIKASCYCKWDGVGDSGELYAGDSGDGFLWKQDITTLLDGAAAISAFCETAYYDLGGSEYNKEITDVYLRCGLSTTQTLTVLTEVTDGTITNSEVLTGANASVTTEYRHSHFGMTANNVAVKLSNATASKDMAIYQISILYEVKALR